ncbi:hypothetical protein C8J56DRAFT_1029819 [Mycena floridula]|nr:hypothetical protein C8J56DRAFT_1029819 [Mycena floridula]
MSLFVLSSTAVKTLLNWHQLFSIVTLQKVVSFLQDHSRGNLIKRLLHHQQTAALVDECMSSLQHALAFFKVQTGVMTSTRIAEMQAATTKRHIELLDFINQPNGIDALQVLRERSDKLHAVLRYLRALSGSILLVLDNLDTAWERPNKRLEAEELLSHLTGVEHLNLVVTMRGAERPAKFNELATTWRNLLKSPCMIPALLRKFTSNIGNIHFTIRSALADPDFNAVKPVVELLFNLNNLYFVTQIGSFDLIQSSFETISQMPKNSQLLGHYCLSIA